jgi:hypothetical protein
MTLSASHPSLRLQESLMKTSYLDSSHTLSTPSMNPLKLTSLTLPRPILRPGGRLHTNLIMMDSLRRSRWASSICNYQPNCTQLQRKTAPSGQRECPPLVSEGKQWLLLMKAETSLDPVFMKTDRAAPAMTVSQILRSCWLTPTTTDTLTLLQTQLKVTITTQMASSLISKACQMHLAGSLKQFMRDTVLEAPTRRSLRLRTHTVVRMAKRKKAI